MKNTQKQIPSYIRLMEPVRQTQPAEAKEERIIRPGRFRIPQIPFYDPSEEPLQVYLARNEALYGPRWSCGKVSQNARAGILAGYSLRWAERSILLTAVRRPDSYDEDEAIFRKARTVGENEGVKECLLSNRVRWDEELGLHPEGAYTSTVVADRKTGLAFTFFAGEYWTALTNVESCGAGRPKKVSDGAQVLELTENGQLKELL